MFKHRLYISALEVARVLILGKYVRQIRGSLVIALVFFMHLTQEK